MTTSILIKSTNPSDHAFIGSLTGTLIAVTVAGMLITALVGPLFDLSREFPFEHNLAVLSLLLFAIGILLGFAAVRLFNQRYARKSADFFHSIRTSVEKETGTRMTDKHILSFLIAGKASDSSGNVLKTQYAEDDFRVTLTTSPS